MKKDGKLKGKDLINIGIYAAIYCVIMTAVAMLGFIPIMMPVCLKNHSCTLNTIQTFLLISVWTGSISDTAQRTSG